MSELSIKLRCEECHATETWRPWFRLTKMGVLRLEGGAAHGFYVDGGHVLCERCASERLNSHAQRETWGEYERRSVEADQEHEAYLDEIVARHPELERRS